MSIKVELKQHMGNVRLRGKSVQRALPQQRVFVDGDFVGYVSDKPGRPFCATVPEKDLLPEEVEAINEAIAKHHGGQMPPEMATVPDADDQSDSVTVETSDDEIVIDPTAEV
jgi:hypothetical protein